MQYADTLLIVVHCRDTNAYTNVCISTILLQLTRWLNGFRWLGVACWGEEREKKYPLRRTLSYLPVVVVVGVVLVVVGGRSIV